MIQRVRVLLCFLFVPIGAGLGVIMVKNVGVGSDAESDEFMEDLMKQVIDGKDSDVTFDNFPFYLR